VKRTAFNHTKTKRLMRILGVRHYTAVGVLELLWKLAADETPTGNIGKLSDDDIAAFIDWDGDPSALIHALVECRWIDEHPLHRLIIHDWADHCEDSVDMWVARHGLLYADGKPARGNRLSREERDKYAETVRTRAQESHKTTQNATSGALPLPLPPPLPCGRKPTASEVSKETSRRPDVRLQAFLDAWNSQCGSNPKAEKLTKTRQRKLTTRLSQGLTLAQFSEAAKRCGITAFLYGDNPRGWVATLDWLIANDTNITKVLEGTYGEPPVPLINRGPDEPVLNETVRQPASHVNALQFIGDILPPIRLTN
jgi:hypothetical protein